MVTSCGLYNGYHGDKELPYFDFQKKWNHSLDSCTSGYFISETGKLHVLYTIRALLRVSVHGQLHFMFQWLPFCKNLRAAKAIFDEEKANLKAEGVAVSDDIKLLIEPSCSYATNLRKMTSSQSE